MRSHEALHVMQTLHVKACALFQSLQCNACCNLLHVTTLLGTYHWLQVLADSEKAQVLTEAGAQTLAGPSQIGLAESVSASK